MHLRPDAVPSLKDGKSSDPKYLLYNSKTRALDEGPKLPSPSVVTDRSRWNVLYNEEETLLAFQL